MQIKKKIVNKQIKLFRFLIDLFKKNLNLLWESNYHDVPSPRLNINA